MGGENITAEISDKILAKISGKIFKSAVGL